MKRLIGQKPGMGALMVMVGFVTGGVIVPHLQLRWVNGPPAIAQTPASSTTDLAAWARSQPVAVAAEKCAPAVVNIDTISNVRQSFGFFGEFTQLVPEKGAGSGVIMTSDGYVLTNSHVIEGANRITVTMADGKSVAGRLIGSDHQTDIAVVKIPGTDLAHATLGDSSHLHPGEWAIAEGNPLGTFSHTVSMGVVSALGRKLTIGDRTYEDLLQTDAAINPGNSGGPLLNIDGDVIGINTATVESAQGISFAIPINTARAIAHELIQSGKIKRAWTGLELADIPRRVARAYHIDPNGAVVAGVDENSPAEAAGLQQGDIIRKANGQAFSKSEPLQSYLNHLAISAAVLLIVDRGDTQLAITLKLGEQP